MKNIKLIMLFCIGALFIASKSFGQANPFINVLPSNSGIVSVGGTIDVIVTIGNTGPISAVPQAKLRPIIQVPPSVTFLPTAQQVGLPAGWIILSNTGSQMRLCNSSDPIPVSTSRTIILKAQGVTIAPAQTFSGNINFGNGTTCAPGTSVAGDLTTDNSALSTIQVVAPITISTISIPNPCNGQQTAQINATITGLTGTLIWSLNPAIGINNNNGNFQDLSGGTYTVSVTNGSASTSKVVILTDPPVFSNTISLVSPSSNNGTNGSIIVTSTGGTPYSGAPGPYILELWQGTAFSGTQINGDASTGIYTFNNLGAGQYFVRSEDFNACLDTIFNITLANPTSNAVLNVKLYLQGYWNGTNMVAARYDNLVAAGSSNPGNATDVDEVIIELRNATTYALEFTATGILQTNGNITVTFPSGAVGMSYYLVVKHQSALQLWSASPVVISGSTSYDFSNDLAKAFTDGSNTPMAFLASGVYGLFMGDVNGDEFIDITDYSVFEIDVDKSTITGLYSLPSDFNGDTFVDLSDYPIFDYNNSLSLYSQHP